MARPLWMLVVPGNDDDQDDDHDLDACDHDDCGGGFIDSDEFGCLWCLVMMIMMMNKMVEVDLYIVMRLDCLHFITGSAEVLVKTLAGKG